MRRGWALQLWPGLLAGGAASRSGCSALDVDSGWMLEEWERELFQRLVIQARGGSVRFVESTPGGGRSHFLALLEQRARRSGLATVCLEHSDQAAVWADPLRLYRAIAEGLLPNRSPGRMGLADWLAEDPSPEAARAELYPELPLWGRALQRWSEQRDPLARDYLMGAPLPSGAADQGWHQALTSRQAFSALRCLLALLAYREERGLVVLGDGDGGVPRATERATLEALRNLLDSCAGGELPGLLLVFGVLPDFRRRLLPEYEALQQRLHNGFAVGPAGCLRPILVLEEQRRWRAEQGVLFPQLLLERLLPIAAVADPRWPVQAGRVRHEVEELLEDWPEEIDAPGGPRRWLRVLARWIAEPELRAQVLTSSEAWQSFWDHEL